MTDVRQSSDYTQTLQHPSMGLAPGKVHESVSYGQAVMHYAYGGGSPVAYSARSFMDGLGGFETTANFTGLDSQLSILSVGQSVSISLIDRHSYYSSHTTNIDAIGVHGHTAFILSGIVSKIDEDKYSVNLEMRPVNDKFDYDDNNAGFILESARTAGWLQAGLSTFGMALFGRQFAIEFVGPGKIIQGVYTRKELVERGVGGGSVVPECFPSGTIVSTSAQTRVPIEQIVVGNDVLAFSDARMELLESSVSRVFRSVSDEFIELARENSDKGVTQTLTATPGHVFLAHDGLWKPLIEMVEPSISTECNNRRRLDKEKSEEIRTAGEKYGEEIGIVRLVTADGDIVVARASHLSYSTATAHLYEEAEMLVTRTEGGLAVQPEWKKGWKTYNFEVEKYHTYIANGIRVHNVSEPIAHNRRGLDDYPSLGLSVVYAPEGLQFYSSQTTNANYDALGGGSFASSAVGWATVAAWTALQEGAPTSIARSAYNVTLAEAKYTVDDNVAHFGWAAALAAARAGNMGPGYLGESLAGFAPNTAAAFAEAGWHAGISFLDSWEAAGGSRYSSAAYDSLEATIDAFLADNPAAQSRSSWRDGNTQANPSDPGTVTTQTSSDGGVKPVLVDLDGDGLEIAAADENFVLFDTDDTGLIHRTA